MDKLQTLHEIDHPEVNVYPNIQPANIPNASIDTSKLASASVTASKIADGAIQYAHISPGAIHEDSLEDGAVTENKLGASAISTGKIADSAITTAKIADGAITTAKIVDHAVTTEKIALGAVGHNELALSLDSVIDYLVTTRGVTDFASAMHEFARLLREGLPLDFFISEDLTKDVYKPVNFYIDQTTPEITMYGIVSGSPARIASLGTDADWTQFVSDYRDILYMKVIR